jgi:peptidylprolyl isomerase domain and WD repeat-containing protein 1
VDAQASPPFLAKSEKVAEAEKDDVDYVSRSTFSMSDQDASVLGKRVHDGPPEKHEDDPMPGPAEEDDDDDDIGPMPMPAGAPSGDGARKKRKGSSVSRNIVRAVCNCGPVLPHEKLYLEHLPAADRYFKSFMHRDAINFNVITK